MALLRKGLNGQAVKDLQSKLVQLGYKLSVDGDFGPGSDAAVRKFQKDNKLSVDGIVGPNTLKLIDELINGAKAKTSTTLKKGAKGEAVKNLQSDLAKMGYSISVDGDFGNSTDRIVRQFQKDNNLSVDGVVGANTQKLIRELIAIGKKKPAPKKTKQSTELPKGDGKSLTEADIKDVAKMLDVEVAAIKSVYEVESRGKGFLSDKRPKILFEGHIFWKELKKAGIDPASEQSGNEDILYSKWSKSHYQGGAGEYDRLNKAMKINSDAAMASASWGTFQIMGFNYKACGFSNVKSYVDAQHKSEGEHLKAFGNFIKSVNLVRHLKSKDWASFAKGYNGPGYKQNKYDEKLAKAYAKHS